MSFVRLKCCEIAAHVCVKDETGTEKAGRNMSRILTMFSSFI